MCHYVDIHTHSPRGENIELATYRLGVDKHVPPVPYAAGIHPWDADKEIGFNELLAWLNDSDIAAIGETGLDYAALTDKCLQRELFEHQLAVASRRNLPLIIHCVKAQTDVVALLKAHSIRKAVFHGFTGSRQQAEQIIGNGWSISFGERTRRSPKSIEALRYCPADRLFLETDVYSASIEGVYEFASDVRQTDVESLKRQIYTNYKRLFE